MTGAARSARARRTVLLRRQLLLAVRREQLREVRQAARRDGQVRGQDEPAQDDGAVVSS